ncbi:hypothetical protein [Chitinophaga sp. HK235]|uniref:TolB family protein n=1 Tax=Chitinophaga sp. HK235 TaxID=2952571 RepID=UPI001BAAD503|nr:hypothetical protein [Chitinophaga sp. HK235]
MKKMLLGSFVLILFSTAILLFQISCKKSADAEPGGNTGGNGSNGSGYTLPPATATTLGGVMVGNGLSVSPTGVLSVNNTGNGNTTQLNKLVFLKYNAISKKELWLMNYDGTGQTKVNVQLGADQSIVGDVRLSPDGKKIFFVLETRFATPGNKKSDIYSCDIDGRNLKALTDVPEAYGGAVDLGGAY